MGNFSFAGEHSTAHHVRLLRSPISVLPGTRNKVITLPGRHGALRIIPDLGERELSLECWLMATSAAELHARLELVRAWLNPLRGQQRLIFDATPDRYYTAMIASGIDVEVTARQGRFALEFVCPDPFAYAITPGVIVITTSPGFYRQFGSAPADPLLRLQGVSAGAGGQQISIAIGDQVVTYRGALAAGEWLEIDCAAKTAVRVVGTTRARVLGLLDRPTFPQLSPGPNAISVVAAGGASWLTLEVHCRNRWL